VIFRIVNELYSATKMLPALSRAMPNGALKLALVPVPLAVPASPVGEPASRPQK